MATAKDQLTEFIKAHNIEHVVALSGGCNNHGTRVEELIEESIRTYKQHSVAILTGGTTHGIPQLATTIAKDHGLKTLGVMPARAYKCKNPALDVYITIASSHSTSEYGDESEFFVKASDAIEFIGGGAGTAIEFYHALKINQRRIRDTEKPIVLAPLISIPGFAQDAYNCELAKQTPGTIPPSALITGSDAATYVLEQLHEGRP